MGCGGPEFPATYPVTGTVMYKSAAVDGATVNFVPADPKGRSASGITDKDGKFTLKTYIDPEHQPDGAHEGSYTITVSKIPVLTPPPGLDQWQEQEWFTKNGNVKSLLPKKYQIPERTDLKATVGKTNEPLTLELKD